MVDEENALLQKIRDGMPDRSHVESLLNDDQWHAHWISWRRQNPNIAPRLACLNAQNRSLQDIELHDARLGDADFWHSDLYKADFSRADCGNAKFRNARLRHARFVEANLRLADFSNADASNADFRRADLYGASLCDANLTGADLRDANLEEAILAGSILTRTNLSGLDLRRAELQHCVLVGADLSRANMSGANVYGVSVWDAKLEGALQHDLVITPPDQPTISVDNLEIAQFMYLLLNSTTIRSVVDTITSKVVLILGRFTPERKRVLDAIRRELRLRNYIPLLFDFAKPKSRNLTETVSTLAHLARFVIADISEARSVAQELMALVPNLPSVPVQPILLSSQQEYGMFEDFRSYPWVLPEFRYHDVDALLNAIGERVIGPAEQIANARIAR